MNKINKWPFVSKLSIFFLNFPQLASKRTWRVEKHHHQFIKTATACPPLDCLSPSADFTCFASLVSHDSTKPNVTDDSYKLTRSPVLYCCDKNANTFVVKNMLPILLKKIIIISKRVMFYNVALSKIANLLWYKWEILIFQS